MGFFYKKMENEATKPLSTEEVQTDKPLVPEGENAPETPEEGVVKADKKKKVVDEVVEDRSAFNCGTCNGDGLIWHDGANRHERCPSCDGTGKVN